jgi:hypothetical protein
MTSKGDVFINVPFDAKHEYLYLSLILSLVALRLTPRSVLEIGSNRDRVTRLVTLIQGCPYSLHDLSCVSLSGGTGRFRVPRFNMAFELGLAVAVAAIDNQHDFRILEKVPFRILQSLSDSNGYDCFVHGGSAEGVFEAVSDIFAKLPLALDRTRFRRLYRHLRRYRVEKIGKNLYSGRSFGELVLASRSLIASV